MTAMWDVVVVGAGPAGATAARELAAAGRSVLLLDRASFPRDKVCGDGLIPDALNALRRAGLYDRIAEDGHPLSVLSAFSPRNIRVDVHGEFMTLRRERLDHILLQAAIERGARFEQARVTELRADDDGVTAVVGGAGDGPRARIAVVATGADVSLLRQAGVAHRSVASAVALRCYVHSPVTIDALVISFHRSILPGYAWIFPLGDQQYNVGCGVFYRSGERGTLNLRETFATFCRQFPLARQLLAEARHVGPLTGARLRCGLDGASACHGRRMLSIGETIGSTFPFTGEGIGKAMETGEIAARQIHRALAEDDHAHLTMFAEVLDRELAPRYTGYRVAQKWLSHPWLNDLVAGRVRRSSRLRHAVAGVLNESVDPRSIFSWRLLVPDWLPWKPRHADSTR
ncbi:MAG: geranylgeranyl reductase family protein [Gemmatimonadota bacterium]|nr:MAG: geranylgeranyl reductase family protein [Gemmatimonadota bacterium]